MRLQRCIVKFRSVRYLQGVIYFDPEIPDGTFELHLTEQHLNGPEILRPLIDQRRLGTSY